MPRLSDAQVGPLRSSACVNLLNTPTSFPVRSDISFSQRFSDRRPGGEDYAVGARQQSLDVERLGTKSGRARDVMAIRGGTRHRVNQFLPRCPHLQG